MPQPWMLSNVGVGAIGCRREVLVDVLGLVGPHPLPPFGDVFGIVLLGPQVLNSLAPRGTFRGSASTRRNQPMARCSATFQGSASMDFRIICAAPEALAS